MMHCETCQKITVIRNVMKAEALRLTTTRQAEERRKIEIKELKERKLDELLAILEALGIHEITYESGKCCERTVKANHPLKRSGLHLEMFIPHAADHARGQWHFTITYGQSGDAGGYLWNDGANRFTPHVEQAAMLILTYIYQRFASPTYLETIGHM